MKVTGTRIFAASGLHQHPTLLSEVGELRHARIARKRNRLRGCPAHRRPDRPLERQAEELWSRRLARATG